MLKAKYFLFAAVTAGLVGAEKNAAIRDYLTLIRAKQEMHLAKDMSIAKLPESMPANVKMKMRALHEKMFDYSLFEQAVLAAEWRQELLAVIVHDAQFYGTPVGESVLRSHDNYIQNARYLLSIKKVANFPLNRIQFFTQRFYKKRGPEKQKQMQAELSPRMGRIFWQISNPGKPEDQKLIDDRTRKMSEKVMVEIEDYRRKGEMPEKLLLPELLRTMLLTEVEFKEYGTHLENEKTLDLDEFLFDLQSVFTFKQIDAFLKAL